jgi:hypothetical protein
MTSRPKEPPQPRRDGAAMNVRTEFVYPPIPDRRFDWSAVDDDTYDGPGSPIGTGPTEEAAIADLMEQM